jgi:simple sugar transport system ATP-binding protein
VVLAKWLAIKPRVLILNGPTVGVDVGSKEDILEILRKEAAQGRCILIISDDVPELVAACHRVLVVRRGRITHTLESEDINAELILERIAA